MLFANGNPLFPHYAMESVPNVFPCSTNCGLVFFCIRRFFVQEREWSGETIHEPFSEGTLAHGNFPVFNFSSS
jgi:hypothetical protein